MTGLKCRPMKSCDWHVTCTLPCCLRTVGGVPEDSDGQDEGLGW